MEFAPAYYDLATFPDGEMKRALLRAMNKKAKRLEDGGREQKKLKRLEDSSREGKKKKQKTSY
jgi:pre-mRNA-splicing factor ATP-dependent RNA helicase DHX15/PRP43